METDGLFSGKTYLSGLFFEIIHRCELIKFCRNIS